MRDPACLNSRDTGLYRPAPTQFHLIFHRDSKSRVLLLSTQRDFSEIKICHAYSQSRLRLLESIADKDPVEDAEQIKGEVIMETTPEEDRKSICTIQGLF